MKFTKDKDGHYIMIKGSFHSEDNHPKSINSLKTHDIKQLKREVDKGTVVGTALVSNRGRTSQQVEGLSTASQQHLPDTTEHAPCAPAKAEYAFPFKYLMESSPT